MLDGRVLGNYPLDQADSTNIAINVGKYRNKYQQITIEACRSQTHHSRWIETNDVDVAIKTFIDNGGVLQDMLKARCAILKGAIESVKPPKIEHWIK